MQKTHQEIRLNNEDSISHLYLEQEKGFNPSHPRTLLSEKKAVIPQALEMVNQTVSIAAEPEKHRYFRKNIFEFRLPSGEQVQSLYHAIGMRDSLHQRNRKEADKLAVKSREMSTE